MTALIADPACLGHVAGPDHPEAPERYSAVLAGLESAGLLEQMQRLPPVAVTMEELAMVHTPEYLALAQREIAAGAEQLSTGDTGVSRQSWAAALAAAGSALAGVDAVCGGAATNAFCVVRPPGHHARPAGGMGFCILNNVALAARRAQLRHGIERVLIVDWDVHHGNGTQDAFYEDGSVFFFSTHQAPWYPGTGHANERGAGAGWGTTLNCPLPAGSGRAEVMAAFQEQLLPAAEEFRPGLILISAGFDSRAGDPLGNFTLSDRGFRDLTLMLRDLAERHASGRIVSVLEGGYSRPGLASAAAAHIAALLSNVDPLP